jgi:hypothetical protein
MSTCGFEQRKSYAKIVAFGKNNFNVISNVIIENDLTFSLDVLMVESLITNLILDHSY